MFDTSLLFLLPFLSSLVLYLSNSLGSLSDNKNNTVYLDTFNKEIMLCYIIW